MIRAGAACAAVAIACATTQTLARVGGGGGYSGGGGGDGDGDGDAGLVFALVRFLLWLVFRHPLIGIPVVIVVVVVVLHLARTGRIQLSTRERPTVFAGPAHRASPSRRRPVNLTPLRATDPFFSESAFIDFAQIVFARAHEMRGAGRREPLEPWMAPLAIDELFADRALLEGVGAVIIGATRLEQASTEAGFVVLEVYFEANVDETRSGATVHVLCEERWTFRRKAGVTSPTPARLRALGCSGCGSTLEPKTDGTCPSCGGPRRRGLTTWEVARIPYANRRPLPPPDLSPGGVEAGTDRPTVHDPRLQAAKRAFTGRHPDHSWSQFESDVRETFMLLQGAWSTEEWERARPWETDALFQTYRFWVERYRAFGLRNRVEGVEVSRIVVVKIDTDPYFESITVRIFARALDWTEGKDGAVVAGSRQQPTSFSEYWTFLRAMGGASAAPGSCPSCAAPLANTGPSAVCSSCGAKLEIASTRWVVSRIEQDDAYE